METPLAEGGSDRAQFLYSLTSLSARLFHFFSPTAWSVIFQHPGPTTTLELSDTFVKQLQKDGKLGQDAGSFVFVLKSPNSSGVLYILSTELLSERSVSHARELIAAVKPDVVVAQAEKSDTWLLEPSILEASMKLEGTRESLECMDDSSRCQELDENTRSKELGSQERNAGVAEGTRAKGFVPTSSFDVVKESVIKGAGVSDYKLLGFMEVLDSIFGTTFVGRISAAKQAADKANSRFLYLETAIADSLKENDTTKLLGTSALRGTFSSVETAHSSIDALSLLSHFNLLQNQVEKKSGSNGDGDECTLSSNDRENESKNVGREDYEVVEPFVGQLVESFLQGYVEAFPEVNELKEAQQNARNLTWLVTKGRLASQVELKSMWYFRQAVETFRICSVLTARSLPEINCTLQAVEKQRQQKTKSVVDMEGLSKMGLEEQQQLLITQALQSSSNQQSCVAVMDGLAVRGVLKHWNTEVSMDVAQFAERYLCNSEVMEERMRKSKGARETLEQNRGNIMGLHTATGLWDSGGRREDEKDAMVTAAAASAFAFWASRLGFVYSAAAKIVGFKAPSIFKAVVMLAERGMFAGGLKALPAAHWASPIKVISVAPKGVFSGKFAVSAKAAAASKSSSASGSAVVQTMIDSAYRSSFQMGRTAFYGLMNGRNDSVLVRARGQIRGWMLLSSTLALCGAVTVYREEVERVIAVAPYARSVALMGQGLQGLREASNAVRSDSTFWRDRYQKFDSRIWRQLT